MIEKQRKSDCFMSFARQRLSDSRTVKKSVGESRKGFWIKARYQLKPHWSPETISSYRNIFSWQAARNRFSVCAAYRIRVAQTEQGSQPRSFRRSPSKCAGALPEPD